MTMDSINASTRAAAVGLATSGKPQALNNLEQKDQIKAAAGQFEAIIVRQLLQDSVGKLAGGEQAGGGMFGYMLTDVLANKLTEGGGLGLSNIFQHQLTPKGLADELAGNAAKGNS